MLVEYQLGFIRFEHNDNVPKGQENKSTQG